MVHDARDGADVKAHEGCGRKGHGVADHRIQEKVPRHIAEQKQVSGLVFSRRRRRLRDFECDGDFAE